MTATVDRLTLEQDLFRFLNSHIGHLVKQKRALEIDRIQPGRVVVPARYAPVVEGSTCFGLPLVCSDVTRPHVLHIPAAPSTPHRQRRLAHGGWRWMVRSYGRPVIAGEFMPEELLLETTHNTELSLDVEVHAAQRAGRRVEVIDLTV